MEIFDSEIASIDFCQDTRLIRTTWKKVEGSEDFMSTILTVMDYYRLLLPKKTLWDHRNFDFQIPPDLQLWTEENINIPAARLKIFEKICFIVSKDTMSQISVMQIFDETLSEHYPRYFVDEGESLQWLYSPSNVKESVSSEPPTVMIDRINGKIRFSIDVETEEFDKYLNLFNKLLNAGLLSVDHAQLFLTLTAREITILKLLLNGKNPDYISDSLSISPHTVKTHRKNIYRKLHCNSISDLLKYSTIV